MSAFSPGSVRLLSAQPISTLSYKSCISYTSSCLTSGWSSNHRNKVWYSTNMVPLCTLVHTARGPTPLNQPAMPSVLYIILSPVMTDDVSNIAAPCVRRAVEGEEVLSRWLCASMRRDSQPEDLSVRQARVRYVVSVSWSSRRPMGS